ncbi:hypothetical protein QFZ99_004686 [Paraburkholderia atlantica]|uniref:hypothetical protein n=1 Tax=Paraburkholderia atlantica TaxID=2654982 RepID=UPI003D1F2113
MKGKHARVKQLIAVIGAGPDDLSDIQRVAFVNATGRVAVDPVRARPYRSAHSDGHPQVVLLERIYMLELDGQRLSQDIVMSKVPGGANREETPVELRVR